MKYSTFTLLFSAAVVSGRPLQSNNDAAILTKRSEADKKFGGCMNTVEITIPPFPGFKQLNQISDYDKDDAFLGYQREMLFGAKKKSAGTDDADKFPHWVYPKIYPEIKDDVEPSLQVKTKDEAQGFFDTQGGKNDGSVPGNVDHVFEHSFLRNFVAKMIGGEVGASDQVQCDEYFNGFLNIMPTGGTTVTPSGAGRNKSYLQRLFWSLPGINQDDLRNKFNNEKPTTTVPQKKAYYDLAGSEFVAMEQRLNSIKGSIFQDQLTVFVSDFQKIGGVSRNEVQRMQDIERFYLVFKMMNEQRQKDKYRSTCKRLSQAIKSLDNISQAGDFKKTDGATKLTTDDWNGKFKTYIEGRLTSINNNAGPFLQTLVDGLTTDLATATDPAILDVKTRLNRFVANNWNDASKYKLDVTGMTEFSVDEYSLVTVGGLVKK